MIGIVFVGELKYCPYIYKYLRVLVEKEEKFEVLFWERESINRVYPQNYYSFKMKSSLAKSSILKVFDFIKFSMWLRERIMDKGYDKLIVLSTLAGIIIANTILKKYKNNYIFDIRDYSYEKYKLFYKVEEKLILNSKFTSISSEGFKNFLPQKYDYIMANNFSYDDLKYKKKFIKKKRGAVINVVWIGVVRYFEHQAEILERLKNDERFNLIYHGSGPDLERLKLYCKDNQISNVCFTGSYDNNMKADLLLNADILNNSYGIKNENKVKYAIANKYYDGIIYGIPQLVEINSFKCEKVEALEIGIGIDVSITNFADELYDYYYNLDDKQFNESCQKELEKILIEDKVYLDSIKNFIESK